ncbi:hypothetical protein ACLI1A_00485 [Flavobacterium sp. RHBU_3]|uniref:hypothetical protein n=1 Tax=Flavobacterium sp. RHBU_3 TaxID=3391184 RepID=UPI003984EA08
MKISEIMYAPMAVEQYTFKFNKENNTDISVTDEVLDGSPFVYIDFKDTTPELIFKYSYTLGEIQGYLATHQKRWLPVEDYPLPPDEDEQNKKS